MHLVARLHGHILSLTKKGKKTLRRKITQILTWKRLMKKVVKISLVLQAKFCSQTQNSSGRF